jgi:hypothetical protein
MVFASSSGVSAWIGCLFYLRFLSMELASSTISWLKMFG